MHNVIGISTNF